jgi:hypothetical protein
MGDTMVLSMHDARSESSAAVVSSAMGGGTGRSSMSGSSYIHAVSRGRARAQTESLALSESNSESHAQTQGDSISHSTSASEGTSEEESSSTSISATNGTTAGISEEEGESEGVTVAPFYEYHREEHVTSRTFMPLDEQLFLAVQQLKMLPKAHFLLKAPGASACFLRAPFVPDPRISARRLDAGLETVYSALGYFPRNPAQLRDAQPQAALPAPRASTVSPAQPLIPEVLPLNDESSTDYPDECFIF